MRMVGYTIMDSIDITNIFENTVGFENLKIIAYRDIIINDLCIKVMGIHFMDLGPDWNVKRHKHSFFEFHYILQGSVLTNINGKDYNIKAQQFYIMPPGTIHSHRQNTGTSHTGFALRWETIKNNTKQVDYNNTFSELEKINATLLGAPSQPLPDGDGIILRDMKNLLEVAEDKHIPLEIQLTFLKLLIHLADFFTKKEFETHAQINHSFLENHIVDIAIKFIEENYMQEIDVNDVSSSAHLSYSHLARLFKKYSGVTIIYHINKARLTKAQSLLLCTTKAIDQIANEVGFNNINYFCTIFKKFYGISPRNFRNKKSTLYE